MENNICLAMAQRRRFVSNLFQKYENIASNRNYISNVIRSGRTILMTKTIPFGITIKKRLFKHFGRRKQQSQMMFSRLWWVIFHIINSWRCDKSKRTIKLTHSKAERIWFAHTSPTNAHRMHIKCRVIFCGVIFISTENEMKAIFEWRRKFQINSNK